VIVGEERLRSLSGSSKYCREEFKYPSPLREPTKFRTALLDFTRECRKLLLIPMTDITCSLVAGIRGEFGPNIVLALPPGDSYEKASQKDDLMRLASTCGVPIPRTEFIDDLGQLEQVAAGLTYPVVIKPTRSRMLKSSGWVTGGVTYAHSAKELLDKYALTHRRIPFPLIQERIVGPGCGVFALFANGESKALFAHRRIREKPPSGGVSVLRESIPVEGHLREYSERILRALKWNGVAMVEYKMDRRDGLPKLMEINGRFWGSLQLAIDSGVDFPHLLYLYMLNNDLAPMSEYRIGVRTRWLLGDLDHLLILWLHRRRLLSLPEGQPRRLRALWNFCTTCGPETRLEIWNKDDWGPAFREVRDYCVAGLRGLWTKIR